MVVHFELVDSVRIRHFELSNHFTVFFVVKSDSHKRIDSHELHLHVLSVISNPLAIDELLDHDGVDGVILDGVVARLHTLPCLVVGNALNLQDSALLEAPLSETQSQVFVPGGLSSSCHGLNFGGEELIREKFERSREDDSGVISGLESGNQHCLLPDSVREIFDLSVGVVAVGGGAASQDFQHQRVLVVHQESNTSVEQWAADATNNLVGLHEVLGISHYQGVFALVLGVVVQMVNDGSAFVIHFKSHLAGNLTENLANVRASRDQNVSAIVDEFSDGLGTEVSAELLDGGREDNDVVVEKLAVLLDVERRVIRHLVGQLQPGLLQRLEVDGVSLLDGEVLQQHQHSVVSGGQAGHKEDRKERQ